MTPPLRILVLEDEDSIRRMISALVQARGFEVVAVGTGAKAIDEAAQLFPDVAILDLMVPGAYDGFEVIQRLRSMETTRAKIPVIVISALDDAKSRERATAAGATMYFVKPFSAIALLKELEAVKARSASQMSMRAVRPEESTEPKE
jgi:DNA-binding response OmpR family regulator